MKNIVKIIYIKLINVGAYFYNLKKYKLAKYVWRISINSGYASNKNTIKYVSLLRRKELIKLLPKIYFNLIEDDISIAQLLRITKNNNLPQYYKRIKLSRAGDQKSLSSLIQSLSLKDISTKIDLYTEAAGYKELDSDIEKLIFSIANSTLLNIDFTNIDDRELNTVFNYCKEENIKLNKDLIDVVFYYFDQISYKAAYNISVYLSKSRTYHKSAWDILLNLYPKDVRVLKNYIASFYRDSNNNIESSYNNLVELGENDLRDNSRYVENAILTGNLNSLIPLNISINKNSHIKFIEALRKSNNTKLCSDHVDEYINIYGEDESISKVILKITLQNGDYSLAKKLSSKSTDDYYKALSCLKSKDVNGAINILIKIQRGDKSYSNAKLLLADIEFYEFEDYAKAITYYEEANTQKNLDYQSNIRLQYCKLQLEKELKKEDVSLISDYDLELIKFSSLIGRDKKQALNRLNKIYYAYNTTPISIKQSSAIYLLFDSIFSNNKKRHHGPLVSVVMTTFKCKKTVNFAINSILNQSYKNIELIIVDDCSNDGTFEYLKEKYKNIKLLSTPKNSGTYVSKNIGMEKSTGHYITFMDSDDWSHPERIYQQVKVLEQQQELVGCTTDHVRMYEDGKLLIRKGGIATFAPISLMIRKKVINELGYFDSVRCSGDSEFISRVKISFGKSSIHNIRCPLLLARQSASSLTTSGKTAITWAAMPKVRLEYKRSFTDWHRRAQDLYLPATQSIRAFECPSDIIWNRNA